MSKNVLNPINSVFGAVVLAATTFISPAASAVEVARGCQIPTETTHTIYYIDPVKGTMSGDGTITHPWHTLAEVFDVRYKLIANAPATYIPNVGIIQPNPNAPIKSGDTILLLSGNHGDVHLQGFFGQKNEQLYGYDNTAFITIAAAPDQKPTLHQLTLKGAGKWIFRGLTFEGIQNIPSNKGKPYTSTYGDDYFLVGMIGPSNNIVFDSNIFQTQGDTSNWNAPDFLAKRVSGIDSIGGTCLTFANNIFRNVGFAIGSQRSNHVLIKSNFIDTFVDDGIDYGSNDTVIDGNVVTNSIDDGDGFHRDAMQGQPYGPVDKTEIVNNLIINQTRASLPSPADLDGIDAFDGLFTNVYVANNIVIINSYHGITFAGARDISIVNNTVIGTKTRPGQGISTWIDLGPSKTGTPTGNAVVRNNIAAQYNISSPSSIVDHNAIATMDPNLIKRFKSSNSLLFATMTTNLFESFQPQDFDFDPRLSRSRAVGNGAMELAPLYDLRGKKRGKTVDLGALAFGGPALQSLHERPLR